jgi:hypothetical protein
VGGVDRRKRMGWGKETAEEAVEEEGDEVF